jgi:hypothetical protein
MKKVDEPEKKEERAGSVNSTSPSKTVRLSQNIPTTNGGCGWTVIGVTVTT